MSIQNRTSRRLATALAAGCAGLMIAGAAGAVDLRDWGRKFPASERFVVLAQFNNEAVLDKETQLVWRISPYPQNFWVTAVSVCYMSRAGGRSGWRLPNISELTSLAGTDAELPAGHPFKLVNDQHLWSSTESAQHEFAANYAFAANLLSGALNVQGKSNLSPYLCVRGPSAE